MSAVTWTKVQIALRIVREWYERRGYAVIVVRRGGAL